MSANWRSPIDAGEGWGEVVRDPPGHHLRVLLMRSECRSWRSAAGGFAAPSPLRYCPWAPRKSVRPGVPSEEDGNRGAHRRVAPVPGRV